MIDRQTFIKLCTAAIEETRQKLTIRNQVSGYLKFHKEIKDNAYFFRAQRLIHKETSLTKRYEMIKYLEMGNCGELACFLNITIAQKLKALGVDAQIKVVKSKKADHIFVHITITLKNEIESDWELDAWHPRMIDISKRRDGSIKNEHALAYGSNPDITFSIFTNDFKFEPHASLPFFKIMPKAEPGISPGATPPRDILKKHPKMYPDFTIQAGYQAKELDKLDSDEIGYLRQVSHWQRMKRKKESPLVEKYRKKIK